MSIFRSGKWAASFQDIPKVFSFHFYWIQALLLIYGVVFRIQSSTPPVSSWAQLSCCFQSCQFQTQFFAKQWKKKALASSLLLVALDGCTWQPRKLPTDSHKLLKEPPSSGSMMFGWESQRSVLRTVKIHQLSENEPICQHTIGLWLAGDWHLGKAAGPRPQGAEQLLDDELLSTDGDEAATESVDVSQGFCSRANGQVRIILMAEIINSHCQGIIPFTRLCTRRLAGVFWTSARTISLLTRAGCKGYRDVYIWYILAGYTIEDVPKESSWENLVPFWVAW